MVDSSPCKKEEDAAVAVPTTTTRTRTSRSQLSSRTSVSGIKPLQNYRFYLDVKNPIVTNKLETKVKEFGGLLELFLVKEVTHVVTDKEEWASASSKGGGICPKTPQTPGNQSSVHNEYGERTPGSRGRPKTRADAMLERARKTPTVIAKDPLEQARVWGIAIWTVEKALVWLEKIAASISKKKKKPKVLELKVPYVKFEAFDRKHRPVFKEIRNWPGFNLRGTAGSSGLIHRSARGDQNMTRKSRGQQPHADVTVQSGYCEICRVEYNRLDQHLETKKHLAFVKDNGNFLELDGLIDDGTNVESFLKFNAANEEKCNGIRETDGKMPRTRSNSVCGRLKSSSTEGSQNSHRRKKKRKASSYNSTDDESPMRETRELRSSHRAAILKIAEQESDTWSSGRPKRACIRQKWIAIDDHVISENRGYYKVEVPFDEKSVTPEIADDDVEEDENDEEDSQSLIVRFRRMRSSELKRLNNEAENFLFPKRDDNLSSSEDDVDADGPDTTVSTAKFESTVISSSEIDDNEDDKSMISSVSSECSGKKKKRLTQAEAFILDNKKYYKFETPPSRLRYQGSFLGDISTTNSPKSNGDATEEDKDVKEVEKPLDDDGKFSLDDLVFSFERVPKSEPWYQTFSRQDEGQEEYFTCFSDSGCWKPFLMPYEMGPIPPLDPKICFMAYTQSKKQLTEELSSGSNSATCSTPNPDSNDGNISEPPDENSDTESSKNKRKRKQDSALLTGTGKNPRKSPRQHASTLAILSSLLQQRKKQLETIPETEVGEDKPRKEAKDIDEMLTNAFDEFRNSELVEVTFPEDFVPAKSNAVDSLLEYESLKHNDSKMGLAGHSRRCFTPGKKPGRKKKKNRTGWPNKSVRKTKKEVPDPTTDDTTIDSLSVNADSDSNPMDLNGTNEDDLVNKNDQSVVYSVNKNCDRVVDLDRWENAEKVLSAKISNDVNKDLQFQPYVRVQKLNEENIKTAKLCGQLRGSPSSPHHRTVKRQKRTPPSPKSPRALRRPRGRWYRER